MIIVWSDEARKTYDNIIDDLIDKWKVAITINFE